MRQNQFSYKNNSFFHVHIKVEKHEPENHNQKYASINNDNSPVAEPIKNSTLKHQTYHNTDRSFW
jgi:hypothetical protein